MMYVDRAFVNGTYVSDVPQKTKGLKKKFGTINPLDITRYCKIPHSQMNQMILLYLGNSVSLVSIFCVFHGT
ncbi:hypothetical protein BKA69DRAFT_1090599 [Paraphysoderma sedebokerense]|nr:hypothetical protein BKA69DRAFT_1090599 [Paraphysoderma sedebokerense]